MEWICFRASGLAYAPATEAANLPPERSQVSSDRPEPWTGDGGTVSRIAGLACRCCRATRTIFDEAFDDAPRFSDQAGEHSTLSTEIQSADD